MKEVNKRVDFVQLQPLRQDVSDEYLRDEIVNFFQRDAYPTIRSNKYAFFIQEQPEHTEGVYFGALSRVQVGEIAPAVDLQTHQTERLRLRDTQGLGSATCFCYDPRTNIIMHDNSILSSAIQSYLRAGSGNAIPSMTRGLVVDPRLMQEFLNMNHYISIKFHIAKATGPGSIFEDDQVPMSVGGAIRASEELNANEMSATLRLDRRQRKDGESLIPNRLRRMVDAMRPYAGQNSEIQKLEVMGMADADGDPIQIDLIKQQLKDHIRYQVDERLQTSLNLPDRIQELKRVWRAHRPGLRASYSIT